LGGGIFFVYSLKLKYMDTIIDFFSTLFYNIQIFLFGVRADGEPAGYPENRPADVRDEDGFFTWCQEMNVGCRSKNTGVFY
jgi:hypothetical protein